MASNAENVSIWWRQHVSPGYLPLSQISVTGLERQRNPCSLHTCKQPANRLSHDTCRSLIIISRKDCWRGHWLGSFFEYNGKFTLYFMQNIWNCKKYWLKLNACYITKEQGMSASGHCWRYWFGIPLTLVKSLQLIWISGAQQPIFKWLAEPWIKDRVSA